MFVSRRMLNVYNFRDESHSNAWDYSAFVRTYGIYLNERLDCFPSIYGYGNQKTSRDNYKSSYDDRGSEYSVDGYDNSMRKSSPTGKQNQNMLLKEMTPDLLLEKLPSLQHLLERMLACRPTGAARHHRLIQIALFEIVRESFQVYSDICEGITVLLDGFFNMEHSDCIKAFNIYSRAAKQAVELSSFYNVTRSSGICRPSEYPTVQNILQDHLDTLEDYLRDRSRLSLEPQRSRSPEPAPQYRFPQPDPAMEDRDVEDFNSIKALPAPPVEQIEISRVEAQQPDADLINLDQATISADEHQNQLALTLFTSTSTGPGNGSWETFGSAPEQEVASQSSQGTSTQWNTASESGKEGWELALVTEASKLSKTKESMAGGFDRLLLDSMYDQAVSSQNHSSTMPAGSASSVALPGKPPSSLLALPAPVSVPGEDPFVASVAVPPPTFVQMVDLRQKQQLLFQEQQLWDHYQRGGMQGNYGMINIYNLHYAPAPPQNSFSLPYYYGNNGGFAQNGYARY
ncbi:hypothetical protein O6H91_07G061000 [Diphasiastrum complanatum]|nr:hypothetical protein O6H91_07G061000 [Diphasiastrum complanatum]